MTLQNQVLQKKKALLLNLYNTYEAHNNTIESAMSILSEVEELISEMNDLDLQLTEQENEYFFENYREVWVEIIDKHKELINLIETESMLVKNQMNQVNKKNQMINGYMDQNGSMFLDRQA